MFHIREITLPESALNIKTALRLTVFTLKAPVPASSQKLSINVPIQYLYG